MPSANKYDQFSYPSAPFDYSHCCRLETVAKLFGLDPKPVPQARVLELGCGDGSNLIPQAETFPEAQFVGVDYAQVPIDQGKQVIEAVGLKNIELYAQNVMDLDPNSGPYDYIVAHGLYSWIPAEVQARTLELIQELLSPQGVAFVSYNILPGWNFKRTVRELMLVHTQQITDPAEKVAQARAILRWVAEASREGTPYRQFLEREIELLDGKPDGYIYHEHLEDQNEAIYFRDFLNRIAANSLQYLGEAEIAYMFWHDIPTQQQRDLQQLPVEVAEQLMDFIRNRAFRKTLLCHGECEVSRQPQLSVLHDLHFAMENQATLEGVDLTDPEPLEMQIGDNALKIPEPLFQAALIELCDVFPASRQAREIGMRSRAKLESLGVPSLPAQDEACDQVTGFLWRLASAGVLDTYVRPIDMVTQLSERPYASALVRYHAEHEERTTSRRHAWVRMDDVSRATLCLLDGTRTREEIVQQVAAAIESGNVKPQGDPGDQTPRQLVENSLQTLALCCLLTG